MVLSASVNSISSMPSPVYLWGKALRLNMTVKTSAARSNNSWIAVDLPRDATAVFKSKNGHDSKSTSDAATEAGEAAVATALLAASEVGALVERMFAARRGGACVNPIVREGGHPDGEGRRVPQLRRDRRSMASR